MIRVKKIGLVIEREVSIKSVLKDGTEITVACEFISAEQDRLYLRYPDNKVNISQYFYEGKTVEVLLSTLDGMLIYPALILYEPEDKLIVVEYYKSDIQQQKRQTIRVKTQKKVEITADDKIYHAYTSDLSAGGMKIVMNDNLSPEKDYLATLTINSNEAPSTLKFCVKKSEFNPDDEKYIISCSFLDITESISRKLMKFCFNSQINMVSKTD